MKSNMWRSQQIIFCCNLVLVLMCLPSCTYNKPEVAPGENCSSEMPQTVSFSKDILPIFTTNCSTSGCHSGSTPEGNLNLEPAKAYSQLLQSGTGYVEVNDPKSSVLYSSLVSQSDPMPPLGKLDPCRVEMILQWMKQGALNN